MPYALALGLFDGVHLGHQAVLHETAAFAAALALAPAVLTFDTAPKQKSFGRITDFPTQKHLIAALCHIETAFMLAFTEAVRNLSPTEFVHYLKEEIGAAAVVVGHDFRFGKDRAGNTDTLCAHLPCRVVAPVRGNGSARVSSTAIRALLARGDMARAARLLGHPHTLCAKVQRGASRGRTLGFSTVNLPHSAGLLRLPPGVYASRMTFSDGVARLGVTNFGVSPTFGGGTAYHSETHVFDFAQEVYGEAVALEVLAFLRPERKFASPEALVAQIQTDAARAKAYGEGEGQHEKTTGHFGM